MGAIPVTKLSVEEYFDLDSAAELPSEFHDGEMLPIEAATPQHGIIALNVGRRLMEKLERTSCLVSGQARVRVSPDRFVVPDVTVWWNASARQESLQESIANPKVIVEVLSRSTMNYDYGEKFMFYRCLESLQNYLLVFQDRPRVEVFHLEPETGWVLNTSEGLESSVSIKSLDLSLPLAQIYAGLAFPGQITL
jgi:Uma2 family endonuclease